MFKQAMLMAAIYASGIVAMEYKSEREQIAAEVLARGFKYDTAKRLLIQKINHSIALFNSVYNKNFKLTACSDPEQCQAYYFPYDMVIDEGIALSGSFSCIKHPTQQYTIGHFANTWNMNATDFTCLRNIILIDLKVKPYVIKDKMDQEVYFYSILKVGDLEFPPVKSNYIEIDLTKD